MDDMWTRYRRCAILRSSSSGLAHAPGQLDWPDNGCRRAEQFGIQPDRVINTRSADALISSRPLRKDRAMRRS